MIEFIYFTIFILSIVVGWELGRKKKHNYLIVEYHDFDDMRKSVYERIRDGYKIHAMTHIPTMDGKSLYTIVFVMPI